MDKEEEYLMMSGIQHFDFCRRQWALIHLEQQWKENFLTVEGRIDHKKCHDDSSTEKRKNLIITRGMHVVSHNLRLSGICDVVEFHESDQGVSIQGYDGKWIPVPVEYKHGRSKAIDADRYQLCAQAIALEEMLVCNIPYGFLYYKQTNQRERVDFDEALREKVIAIAAEMNQYYQRGWTPRGKYSSKCKACSLNDLCLPELQKAGSVTAYINKHIEEEGYETST